MRVKICGLTREDDVRMVCAAGADALGFVMVPGTKRHVAPARVRELARQAHPFVLTVGVVADLGVEEAIALADAAGVGALQLHGSETVETCLAIKRVRPALALFKAIRLRSRSDLPDFAVWNGLDGVLLDSGAGSGVPFDWSWLDSLPQPPVPLIVAGGLDPSNVGALLAHCRPAALDVSSGVESGPGRKDPAKVGAFLAAVANPRFFSA